MKLTKAQISKITSDKRKKKYPWNLERFYAKIISKHVRSWENVAKSYVNNYIKPYVVGGTATLKDEETNNGNNDKVNDKIKKHYGKSWYLLMAQLLEDMGVVVQHSLDERELYSEVYRFIASLDSYSLANVKLQVGAIGLNPIVSDEMLKSYLQGDIAYNVSLIKSMSSKYAHDLENDIYRTLEQGGGIGAITQAIVDRTGMNIKHAKLIATDQTGKILGQLNAYRQQKAGATAYIWQSMEDNRVRPAHQALDQTVQKYNDPNGGDNGQMPGEPINCRCVPIPVFEDNISPDSGVAGDD